MNIRIVTVVLTALSIIVALAMVWGVFDTTQAQATTSSSINTTANTSYLTPVVLDGDEATIPLSLKKALSSV